MLLIGLRGLGLPDEEVLAQGHLHICLISGCSSERTVPEFRIKLNNQGKG